MKQFIKSWSKYILVEYHLDGFLFLCTSLLLCELLLGILIIHNVSYTEIDWSTYMQQVSIFQSGERNYLDIKGSSGPCVYPAGFLYVFSWFSSITENGQNIRQAQYLFLGIYLLTQASVFHLLWKVRPGPAYLSILLCLSHRMHSLYMLRLFNDGVSMCLFYLALNCFILDCGGSSNNDDHHQGLTSTWIFRVLGYLLYSSAVSIKMNVLLFAPGLLYLTLTEIQAPKFLNLPPRVLSTLVYLGLLCGGFQLLVGWSFLTHAPRSYLLKAFELHRVFEHQWSVNWHFISPDVFHSSTWSLGLVSGHVLTLVGWVASGLSLDRTNVKSQQQRFVSIMFMSNFIGICWSRTLHYQFYSWYFHSLPFLLWLGCPNLPEGLKLLSWLGIEFAFQVFPATNASSLVLQCCHLLILGFQFVTPTMNEDHHDRHHQTITQLKKKRL